jgi:hypothetical protein
MDEKLRSAVETQAISMKTEKVDPIPFVAILLLEVSIAPASVRLRAWGL